MSARKSSGFFNWNPNETFDNVGGDAYALYEGPFENTVTISGSSSFGLQGQPSGSKYLYTLDELKAKYPAGTPVGIWVGVTRRGGGETAGSKSAVINSVTVTKKTVSDPKSKLFSPLSIGKEGKREKRRNMIFV